MTGVGAAQRPAVAARPQAPRRLTLTRMRLAARLIRRGTMIMTVVMAGMALLVVSQYRQTFSGDAEIASLSILATNPAIRVLFGVPTALEIPGGFLVWRTGTFAAVAVACWAFLVATRITRGEEEAGRWSFLLSGPVRLPRVVADHLLVLLGAQLCVGVVLAFTLVVADTGAGGALVYGGALTLIGGFFAAVGLLAAQVFDQRRHAVALAAAVLGVALFLRMIGDASDGLSWLRWLTPIGLLAEAEPYGDNRVVPLLVLAAATAAIVVAAILGAGRRDLGAGVIRTPGTRRRSSRLVRSLPRFVVRQTLPGFAAWGAGLVAYFLLIGLLAQSVSDFINSNPRFGDLAAQSGFEGLGTVQGYVGSVDSLLGIPLGLFCVSRLNACAVDELAGRLSLVFSRPLRRWRWAFVHCAVLAVAAGLLAVAAGVAAWVGTTVVGAPLRLGEALAGALNLVPVGLVGLGAALFALGWLPRAVSLVGALPVVGGFLLLVLADSFRWPEWVVQLSPFSHVATVPVETASWTGVAGLLLASALLAGLGLLGIERRDLRG